MRRSFLLSALLPAALLMSVALAACADDDDGDDVPRTPAALPATWPGDFPVYQNATLLNASDEEGLIGATWETDDDIEVVRSFYDGQFDAGPWREVFFDDLEDSYNWIVENGDEPANLTIAEDDDGTTIVALIGELPTEETPDGDTETPESATATPESRTDDAPPGDSAPGAANVPAAGTGETATQTPVGFPDGMPVLPAGARLIDSSTADEAGIHTARVEYEAPGAVADAARQLTADLSALGWTQTYEQGDDTGVFTTYANSAIENDTLSAAITNDDGRTTVTLTYASLSP